MQRLVLFAALFPAACGLAAAQQPCTDLAPAAQQVQTWPGLHDFFLDFQHCWAEDAEVPSPAAVAITHVLVDQWDRFGSAERMIRSDRGFEHFLLSGINASDDRRALKIIRRNGRLNCPGDRDRLCRAIWTQARDAMVGQNPADDTADDASS